MFFVSSKKDFLGRGRNRRGVKRKRHKPFKELLCRLCSFMRIISSFSFSCCVVYDQIRLLTIFLAFLPLQGKLACLDQLLSVGKFESGPLAKPLVQKREREVRTSTTYLSIYLSIHPDYKPNDNECTDR